MSSTVTPTDEVSVTPLGVDVGVKNLVTVASADAGLDDALTRDGSAIRRELDTLADSTQALWHAPGDSNTAEVQLLAARWHRIRAILYDVAEDVVEYARQYVAPVLVLEDLEPDREPLWEHRTRNVGMWLMPTIQAVLTDRATDAGVPVTHVDPTFTSQECHRCGEIGELENDTIRCLSTECPVETVCRDRSAAVSIGQRF